MDWFEIIHLRSYSAKKRDEALTAFQDLLPPDRDGALEKIVLFENRHIGNDLGIYLFWRNRAAEAGKSPLGLQLAAAFSEFGQISHSVWTHATSIKPQYRRSIHEDRPSI